MAESGIVNSRQMGLAMHQAQQLMTIYHLVHGELPPRPSKASELVKEPGGLALIPTNEFLDYIRTLHEGVA